MSSLDVDPNSSRTIQINTVFIDDEGNGQGKQWDLVLVKDHTFLIEGDVDRPTIATLIVYSFYKLFETLATLLIEPVHSEYVVRKLGDQSEVFTSFMQTFLMSNFYSTLMG